MKEEKKNVHRRKKKVDWLDVMVVRWCTKHASIAHWTHISAVHMEQSLLKSYHSLLCREREEEEKAHRTSWLASQQQRRRRRRR